MNPSPQNIFSLDQVIDIALNHHQEGRLAAAEVAYRKAISIKPNYAEVYINLGNVLYELGRLEEAKTAYCQAITIEPDCSMAHCNLANLFYVLGRRDEAEAAYHQAITFKPDYPEAHCNLGNVLYDVGRFDEAAVAYRQAIIFRPDFVEAYSNLGNALKSLGHPAEAEEAFRQAIAVKPDYAEAFGNLGNVLRDLCRLDEAVAACRQAIVLKQNLPMAHSNLLLTQQYLFSISHKKAFGEALDFGRFFEKEFKNSWGRHQNIPDSAKRLKVGFVSGDLRNHPVGYFLETVLQHVNQEYIALFAYVNQSKYDALSERIRPYFEEWTAVKDMPDEEMVSRIRSDGIDILIDLAGHTSDNRLLVFARKPAPVQVTWLGYPNTTGLHAIDYILADPITAPPGEEKFYTERIWRLPESYICFTPPDNVVTVSSLPALENGYVTFGSFNNPVKINDTVISCWAEILRRIPDSVLLFKNGHLASETICESLRKLFLTFGIEPERLFFEGVSSRDELLASYRRVDIALDPFPYSGTTTTCEGTWMGVPTLTLKMSRGIYSHSGELIMRSVGLPEWVAESIEEYIGKALEFAKDLHGIALIRAELRRQLLTSPLCNAPRFANNLESALRGMWQHWCSQKKPNESQPTRQPAIQRKLHIGGMVRTESWEIFSINEGDHVDHVGNANDLSRFPDNTFSAVYASHVLEHFDYKGELLATLVEWSRVLKPGGVLSVSVPDLDVLAKLYLDKTAQNIDDRFLLMSMMFGGHVDDYDYHKVGLNEELLCHCLEKAEFVDTKKVTEFGMFEDTSNLRFKGELISLNMVTYKKTSCIKIA